MIQTLCTETDKYVQQMTNKKKKKHATMISKNSREKKESKMISFHVGYWRPYNQKIIMAADTKTEAFQEWHTANAKLFALVDEWFTTTFPGVAEEYKKAQLPGSSFFGAFHMCAININADTKFHRDKGDVEWGLCIVIPFGPYTDGYISFPELGLQVYLAPGDTIAFRSARLLHGNMQVIGNRNSLVLFCPSTNFFPCQTK